MDDLKRKLLGNTLSKIKNFANSVVKKPMEYFNPESNGGNNFWGSKAVQNYANSNKGQFIQGTADTFTNRIVKPYTDLIGEAGYQGSRFMFEPNYRKLVLKGPESLSYDELSSIDKKPTTKFLKAEQIKDRKTTAKTAIAATTKAELAAIGFANPVNAIVTGGISGLLGFATSKLSGSQNPYYDAGSAVGYSPVYAGINKLTALPQANFTKLFLPKNASIYQKMVTRGTIDAAANFLTDEIFTPLTEMRAPTTQERLISGGTGFLLGSASEPAEAAFKNVSGSIKGMLNRWFPKETTEFKRGVIGKFLRDELGRFVGLNQEVKNPTFVGDVTPPNREFRTTGKITAENAKTGDTIKFDRRMGKRYEVAGQLTEAQKRSLRGAFNLPADGKYEIPMGLSVKAISKKQHDINVAKAGVINPKKQKYQIIKYGNELESVEGNPVKVVEGIDTFIHKINGEWVVSESSSGRSISKGRGKNEAVAKASEIFNEQIKKLGLGGVKELIESKKIGPNMLKEIQYVSKVEEAVETPAKTTKGEQLPTEGVEEVKLDEPDNPTVTDNDRLANVVERSAIISKIKNIADNSGTLNKFKKTVGMSAEALDAMKVAGFPDIDSFWKYTHSGFNKTNNLLNESLAQTKYRLQKATGNRSVDFTNEMRKELQSSDGAFRKLPTGNKVQIWDYLRTPDRVLEKIGMGNEAKLLRRSWDRYLEELPIEIDKVTAWSKEVPRPESNQLIFKYLDGQITSNVLDPQEQKVAKEIKAYLDVWADKLGLPKEARISNYITHIFDGDDLKNGFPEDIAALIRDKVPGSVYDPFTLKRLGTKGYVEDTWRALDAYVKRATRKVNMDPILKLVKEASDGMEDRSFKYIKNYMERINMRPTEADSLLDDFIKATPIGYKYGDRPLTRGLKGMRQMVYRGLLGLNPGSALKNLSQGANTYAELGEKYTILGYYKVVKELPSYITGKDTELERVGVLRDNFVQDRTINATKKFWEKTDKVLFYMFELAEKVNRGSAYFGAKARALAQGKTEEEAIEIGKELVRKTQFTFGSVDTPVVLQSDIMKTLMQFQSFTLKQGEYLGEKIGKKEWAGLVRYTASSLLFIYTVGKMIGMDPEDIIPSFRMTEEGSVFERVPTFRPFFGAYQVATGAKDKYGQDPDPNIINRALENKNLTRGIMSYVPAGNQMMKTYEGTKSYIKGYSESKSGRVQHPVEQNTSNLFKSTLLGKYSTPESIKYYKDEVTPLSEKQSDLFKSAPKGDKLDTYTKVLTARVTSKEETAARDTVEKSGQMQETENKIFYWNEEQQQVSSVQKDRKITVKPLTGDKEIDEKIIAKFKSDLTSKEKDIYTLWELGKISQDEAVKQIQAIKQIKTKMSKPKSKKAKTLKLKAPKLTKIKTKKIGVSKSQLAKLISKQKTGKKVKLSVPRIYNG